MCSIDTKNDQQGQKVSKRQLDFLHAVCDM